MWVVAPDGSGLRQLTHASGTDQAWAPDWSPDGEQIIHVHQRAGRPSNDLDVIGLDGWALCTLPQGMSTTGHWDPDWGPSDDR